MLRWVAVSEDRWELRKGKKQLGALILLPASGWAKQNGFCDVWAPLPRGGKYLSAGPIKLAARNLIWNVV